LPPPCEQSSRGLVHPEPSPAPGFPCCPRRTQTPLAGLGVSLDVEVRTALGALRLDMKVQIEEGEVVALLGPNGAGKTTLLRTIAGLVPIQSGHVELDGEILEKTATGRYVPIEQRSIGVVIKDNFLLTHLIVFASVDVVRG